MTAPQIPGPNDGSVGTLSYPFFPDWAITLSQLTPGWPTLPVPANTAAYYVRLASGVCFATRSDFLVSTDRGALLPSDPKFVGSCVEVQSFVSQGTIKDVRSGEEVNFELAGKSFYRVLEIITIPVWQTVLIPLVVLATSGGQPTGIGVQAGTTSVPPSGSAVEEFGGCNCVVAYNSSSDCATLFLPTIVTSPADGA